MCQSHVMLALKDPTQTTVLRNQFVSKMKRRFNIIKRLSKDSVAVNDCFGLHGGVTFETFTDNFTDAIPVLFPLPTNSMVGNDVVVQTESFMAWLEEKEKDVIFQQTALIGAGSLFSYWFSNYLIAAYKKGVIWGRGNLKKAYLAAKLPRKAAEFGTGALDINIRMSDQEVVKKISSVLDRSLSDLQGINAAMNTQIRREILDGLSFGSSPAELSTMIADRINNIGIHRASLLARTEIIRAHHLASIQEYRNAGIEGVMVKAEFTTARDSRVCSKCAPLDYKVTGKLWSLNEIEGRIPVHPNCRCAALPVVIEEE